MAYSVQTDLLLGDIATSPNMNLDAFIQNASDEIDARLGAIYVVPLIQSNFAGWVWSIVKQMANKIATGRILLAINSAGENTAINAYGFSLLKEGLCTLEEIVAGRIELPGATGVATPPSADGNGPTILNYDQYSGVDTFYDNVMDPPLVPTIVPYFQPWWRPGRYGGIGPPHGVQDPSPGKRTP